MDYLTACERAKRLGRRKPTAVRVGGARIIPRWNWSKGYRACVTASMAALRRIETYLPYAGDVPCYRKFDDKRHDASKSPDGLDIMRAALAVLENRGVNVREAKECDVSNLTAVLVEVGNVSHVVNLAPRSTAWFPDIMDTMPGKIYAGWYPGCPKTREEFEAEHEAQRAQAA